MTGDEDVALSINTACVGKGSMDSEFMFPFPIIFVPRIRTFRFSRRIDWQPRLYFGCDGLLKFADNVSIFPKFEVPVVECCPQR